MTDFTCRVYVESPSVAGSARRAACGSVASRRNARGTVGGTPNATAATGEMLAAIFRAIDAERQCCRFLRFSVTIAADGGPIFLELTGPQGTRQLLRALLDA